MLHFKVANKVFCFVVSDVTYRFTKRVVLGGSLWEGGVGLVVMVIGYQIGGAGGVDSGGWCRGWCRMGDMGWKISGGR